MRPEEIYCRLIEGSRRERECFDTHVVASILALSLSESLAEARPVIAAVGLDAIDLAALVAEFFGDAGSLFAPLGDAVVTRGADESCLVDLLQRCATTPSLFTERLATIIARRAQRPNHLWQDLGFRNRRELSQLMSRNFAPLAQRNTKDMKWKKFLYRTICRDTAYSLCTAPSCAECDDFEICFGEESGESFLARARRSAETAR